MTILIVEDDIKIRNELSKLLEANGYNTVIIDEFNLLYKTILGIKTDLILMDVNLPYEDGFDIINRIKKEVSVPVIFVTSRNTDEDELKSIKVGGVDFISKPYNKSILLEKIRRVFNTINPLNYKEISRNGYTLDLHLSILKFNDKEIELTRNEFKILYYFFTTNKDLITKDELLEYLWNDKYYLDENILLVNINRLRKKAHLIGISDLITTVRGKGYRL